MKEKAIEGIDTYLKEHHWHSEEQEPGRRVYYKNRNPRETSRLDFLTYSKSRKQKELSTLADETKRFFTGRAFQLREPLPVVNQHAKEGEPFFIVAGIQGLSEHFNAEDTPNGAYFISQPVVRTKYREHVGEGRISSFVNITTGKVGVSVEDHLASINTWMDFLSAQGLFLGDFVLKLRKDYQDSSMVRWGGVDGVVLKFLYGGFELGSAGLVYFNGHPQRLVSDIGFGLERIAWSIGKHSQFSDVLGPKPYSFRDDYKTIDALRTATLMGMSGIKPDQEDAFRQFRAYLTRLAEKEDVDAHSLVKYYFSFWSGFVTPTRKFDETYSILNRELNRAKNMGVLNKLNAVPVPRKLADKLECAPDEFRNALIQKGLCSLEKLRELEK